MKQFKRKPENARHGANIIDRGFYRHAQNAGGVTLKQYIVTKKDGKKLLHLRFFNESDLAVTEMHLKLSQYSKTGKLLSSKTHQLKKLKILPGSTFVTNVAMVLDDACIDFFVDVVGLYSNGFKYAPVHGKLMPRYDARRDINSTNGAGGTVSIRKSKAQGGKISAFIAFLLMLTFIGVFVYLGTRDFGNERDLITMEYEKTYPEFPPYTDGI